MSIRDQAFRPVRIVALLLVVMSLALLSQLAFPRSYTAAGGPGGTPDFAGNPPNNNDCSGCHNGDPDANGGVRVTKTDGTAIGNTYSPETKYNWLVEVFDTNAARNRWGYELTIIWDCANPDLQNKTAGTLAPGDEYSNLKPSTDGNRKFLTHYGVRQGDAHVDGTYGGNTQGAHWAISWTAPAKTDPPCNVKIYVTGVASNGDSLARPNDGSYAAVIPLTIDNPTAVRKSTWGWVKNTWR